MTMTEKRLAFYRKYRGTPYRKMGRSPSGLDCWGLLVAYFYEVHGLVLPDPAMQNGPELEAILMDAGDWEPIEKPEPECGIYMRVAGLGHVGVCQEGGRFLHCSRDVGVVVEQLDTPMWRKRVLGYYRHPLLGGRK